MKNILAEIYQHKLVEVRERKKVLSVQEICARTKCGERKIRDFFAALKSKDQKQEVGLICEVKKASPSHGIIRQNFDAVEIAEAYEAAGAACLSVLTDEKYFMGADKYLIDIMANSTIPILRKDFMVDTYQIYEAKMIGADCILLIVAMLEDAKLRELEQCALDSGLSVLIEVHNEEELQRASRLKSKLIGINNRDLKTLKVNLETSLFLAEQVPNDYVLVAESGIADVSDVELLRQAGINCFLIGEHFMRQDDVGAAVEKILRFERI